MQESQNTQAPQSVQPQQGLDLASWRFALAWLFPLAIAHAAWIDPWRALALMVVSHLAFALLEAVPGLQRSPEARASANAWHRLCVRMHVPLQALLLVVACLTLQREQALAAGTQAWTGWVALGVAVGWVTGSQGISIAHELGHSRSRLDRALAWGLMSSVLYAHFMVEHYRGHHVRAATPDDPATARRGEGLWRFLPRTLWGCWRSAWQLERARWARGRHRGMAALVRSPLVWAMAAQGLGLWCLGLLGGPAFLVFWVVQSATAVFLLESVNYIEHYGLLRARRAGRTEAFAMQHAWNADSLVTNSLLANLQRHSDHHVNPGRPYPALQALPGPQLPTGYAGCLLLAMCPPLWRHLMDSRLAALDSGALRSPPL